MGRLVDVDDLVSAAMVAARIGETTATVLHWAARRADMPASVVIIGDRTKLWLWSELRPWLIEVGVLTPRLEAILVDMATDPVDPEELLSARQVAELLGWSDSGTAWRLHRSGTFPAPVRQERPRLWRASDVEDWARTHPRRPRRRKHPGLLRE